MIYKSVFELVGNTPLIELCNIEKKYGAKARILAKVEFFNPAGSIKDRAAREIIEAAEKKGLLKKDTVIIEPTSGNTGIGLAALCAERGYRVILTMPETMSIERRKLLAAYGAELVLTDGASGMSGAVKKAEELTHSIPGSIIAGQFTNNANPDAHYKTTAPEIWADTDGAIDIFISAVGTGGTITGCGRYFKEKSSDIKIVAVEPKDSPLLSKGHAGQHKIQGIGANFIPDILDVSLIDEIITAENDEATGTAAELAKAEGLLVGISSGAALSAAIKLSLREENEGKNIVVIFPDTGDRYLA